MPEKKLFLVVFKLTFVDGEKERVEILSIPTLAVEADEAYVNARGVTNPVTRLPNHKVEYVSTHHLSK